MTKTCEECGNPILSRRANIYCGTTCRNRGIAKNRRSYKMEGSPTWNGGRKLCSGGYVLVKHPDATRKDGYIQEHRLVIENHFGKEIDKGDDIHHIDGDKQNNQLKNLVVISRSAHMSLHANNLYITRERDSYGRFK